VLLRTIMNNVQTFGAYPRKGMNKILSFEDWSIINGFVRFVRFVVALLNHLLSFV